MRLIRLATGGAGIAAILMSLPAMAADELLTTEDGAVTLSGGVGVVALEANEIIYNAPGSSNHISQLIWQSLAPTLTAALNVDLPQGWTLEANAQVAMGGDSYMEDYDWIEDPWFIDYQFDNWTHRSQHEATDLNWYFTGSVLIGHDFHVDENVTVNVNGGLKYTDVQWTGYGGDFVYSTGGFRDDIFTLPDSVKGITYRQQYPAVVAGLDAEFVQDAWTFDLSAHAGVTFNASTRDDHWLRDLVILGTIDMAPIVSLAGQAEYALSEDMSVFLGGSVEKVFTTRGDLEWWESGVLIPYLNSEDSAGVDLFAATVTAGLKGTF